MAKASFADQSEGGNIYVGPGIIRNPRFAYTNMRGKVKGKGIVALLFDFEHQDDEGDIVKDEVICTVNGYGKNTWKPSEDGKDASDEGTFLFSDDEDAKLNSGVPFSMFEASLREHDNPIEDNDVSNIDGLKVNLQRKDASVEQSKNRKVYVVEEILDSVPWEEKKGKKTSKKDKDEDEKEEKDEADEVNHDGPSRNTCLDVMGTVVKSSKKVTVGDLGKAIYAAIEKSHKDLRGERKAIADACKEDEFLESTNKVFKYDSDENVITPFKK